MKISIEAFFNIFLIVILSVFCVNCLTISADIRNAQRYHASVISELEVSEFDPTIINRCIENAESNGYVVRKNDGTIENGLTIEQVPGTDTYKVVLNYSYGFLLINEVFTHQFVGYAK